MPIEMKFKGNIDSFDFARKEKEEKVKLSMEEAELYTKIFNREVGAPIEVRESLKECLKEFVSMGLNENNKYADFVELADEAMDHGFDSVEKDRLHIINDSSSTQIICRHKAEGRWKVVAVIEKSLLRKFNKNKSRPIGISNEGLWLSGRRGRGSINSNTNSIYGVPVFYSDKK